MARKVKKVKKTKKVSSKKVSKKTSKKSSGGSAKHTMHYKASTWGMARESFKRGLKVSRDKVFVTAKKCKNHDNCYIVTYKNRAKKTDRPAGSASDANDVYFRGYEWG